MNKKVRKFLTTGEAKIERNTPLVNQELKYLLLKDLKRKGVFK